jgi:hypothetical protein
MKFDLFAMFQKYLPLVLVGVHAAKTVSGASNSDKRAVVLAEIVGVSDSLSAESANPIVQSVGMMIDLTASIINSLTTKTAAAAAPPVSAA